MPVTPAIANNPEVGNVPTGAPPLSVFGWLGKLFVPDAVEASWIQNDADIRARAQNDASSKDIAARIADSPAMLDSANNVRTYTSSPFIGDVLTGDQLTDIIGTSVLDSPKVLLNYVGDNVLAPAAGAVNKTATALIPAIVWWILGIAVVGGVLLYVFLMPKRG